MAPRRLLSTTLAAGVALAGVVAIPAGGATAASTYKACANKKTGEMRLVVKGKKCKKNEKKLKWNVKGPAGSSGAPGAQGPAGARGPAGAFNAIDQTGKVLGQLVGFWASAYPIVRMPSGVMLMWTNSPSDPNAYPTGLSQVYFRQAGCTGDAYGIFTSSYPFDMGIVIASTPTPGSPVYRLQAGTPQAFTALSTLTPSGCVATSSGISQAYVAKPAGNVPTVVQPFYYEPQS